MFLTSEGLVTVADVNRRSTIDIDNVSGFVSDVAMGGQVVVGNSECGANWPEAAPGRTARVRFGAFDTAGNLSGWSDETRLTMPLGCSAASSASMMPWVLFVLVVIRRRRCMTALLRRRCAKRA